MISGSIQNTKTLDIYKSLSTGKRINSAANDAAGLAITEKIQAELQGIERGSTNTLDMKNLLKTAEGGLSSISDSLQRVRELSVQASNGIYTDDDKKIIQNEISQLMQGISDTVGSTQFNKQNLLDGSFQNKNTASYSDGTGKQVSIGDMSLRSLGIENFDVTGSFDISTIDNAINKVSASRSQIGATMNAFDHTVASNDITMLNMAAAKSRIADTDMTKATSDLSKQNVLMEYQMYTQKMQMQSEGTKLSILSK